MTPGVTEPVSGRSVAAALGLWIGAGVVLATAGYYGAGALAGWDTETPVLAAVFIAFALLPVAALVVYRPSGLRDRLAVRWVGVPALGLGVLTFVAALAANAAILLPFGAVTDVVRDATDMARFDTARALDWALIVPRALILAGITEELLFRGILYGWLAQHLSTRLTIVVTAALFAIEHGYFPLLLAPGLIFGLALGWLRARTGSILPGLLAHILTDTLLFAIALILTRTAGN